VWCLYTHTSAYVCIAGTGQYPRPDGALPVCMPACGYVKAVLVQFESLWHSHGDAGDVLGFSHTALDEYQRGWHTARALSYPLWMYPYTELSPVGTLLVGDFATPFTGSPTELQLPVTKRSSCTGIL
jgi:hypothetical protein